MIQTQVVLGQVCCVDEKAMDETRSIYTSPATNLNIHTSPKIMAKQFHMLIWKQIQADATVTYNTDINQCLHPN